MTKKELTGLSKSIKDEIETKKEYKKFNKLLQTLRTEPHEFKFKNILLYLIDLFIPKTEQMKWLNKSIFNKLKVGQTGTTLANVSYSGYSSKEMRCSFKRVYPYFSKDMGIVIGHVVYKQPGYNSFTTNEINIFGISDGNMHFHIPFHNSADITIEG